MMTPPTNMEFSECPITVKFNEDTGDWKVEIGEEEIYEFDWPSEAFAYAAERAKEIEES